MKLTTGYKKPIASSGTDALELSSNNSYLLLAGGGHKALSELVSPADLTTELSNYVTIGSNLTITGVKTFSLAINADITGNADTVDGEHAAAFAHIGAHNNLTVNNEFTFASSGFSGDIWLNYRTAGGTNGNITDYIFGNGKGGQLYSLKTIAANAFTAYSWGNHANVGYLLRSDIGSLSVNYATNAGNAGTLNGHTSDDFVLKTTHDVYESVIVESLNDLDNRKIEISDLPTSLPANGGHAATATNVDWSGITNKPSSFPANGGNADTINGYSSSDFVLNTNYGEFKSVVATALTDLDNRKIEVSDIPASLPADGGNADTVDGLHAADFVQNITVDPVTTGAPGSEASVTTSKINSDVTLHFTIPRGANGTNGKDGRDGISPTISVGTVTTVASTESASVINSGTSNEAILDFRIPSGPQGVNGKDGISSTVRVGSVMTVTSNESATVTNSGTSQAAILDFRIPKGADGVNGKDADEDVVAIALNDLDNRKIDKEDGKGLSTNDYTTDEKNKLVGIEEGAQVNDPNTVIDANYVHTDNNYTTTEKNKLSGIETGALVNTVNSVAGKTGNVTLNVSNIGGLQSVLDGKQDNLEFTSSPSSSNKVVTQNELNSAITGQSSYLGTIESVSSLLTTAKKGDFYRIKTAWDGVHVGDIIIAEKDNPAAIIDEVNWSLLHNEMDTDTTYTFEDGIDGFSVIPSVGNKLKVNISVGYATSAGNAETLDGKNADDFIQRIKVGEVTTGKPGTSVSVNASDTRPEVVLDFSIPRGADGKDGISPTIEIGTVTTVPSTENASVVNSSETNDRVVLNFSIPRGANGNMYEVNDEGYFNNNNTKVYDYCIANRVWQILLNPTLPNTDYEFVKKIEVPVPSLEVMTIDAGCIKLTNGIKLNVANSQGNLYVWSELHWLLRCSNTDCIVYTTKYAIPAYKYPSVVDIASGTTVYSPASTIEISVSCKKENGDRYVQITIENEYGRAYYNSPHILSTENIINT